MGGRGSAARTGGAGGPATPTTPEVSAGPTPAEQAAAQGGEIGTARTSDERNKLAAQQPDKTVVASSKKGTVEVQREGGRTRFVARKRSGEKIGTYNAIDNAREAVERPPQADGVKGGFSQAPTRGLTLNWKEPKLESK